MLSPFLGFVLLLILFRGFHPRLWSVAPPVLDFQPEKQRIFLLFFAFRSLIRNFDFVELTSARKSKAKKFLSFLCFSLAYS